MSNKNLSPEQLIKMTQLMQSSGLSEAEQKKNLTDFAMKNMSSSQNDQLKKILGDADAVKNLMNSKAAQDIMQRLKNQK